MDRRGFLTGVGTLGAVAAGGWTALEHGARSARAEGLAQVAEAGTGRGAKAGAQGGRPLAQGLSVGFLPGSTGLLDHAARGRPWNELASQMRWSAWHPSLSRPVFDPMVDVSLGLFQSARVHANPGMLRSLEVVAHFALDVSPHFAPFNAWGYESAGPGKLAKRTSPLTFEAAMPDRVGLQVNYALDKSVIVPGMASSGMVYLPLGARDGPGTGIYVLASPSRVTGAVPDFTEYTFSGDLVQPLRRNTGGTPDFDFVTLTIAPVVA